MFRNRWNKNLVLICFTLAIKSEVKTVNELFNRNSFRTFIYTWVKILQYWWRWGRIYLRILFRITSRVFRMHSGLARIVQILLDRIILAVTVQNEAGINRSCKQIFMWLYSTDVLVPYPTKHLCILVPAPLFLYFLITIFCSGIYECRKCTFLMLFWTNRHFIWCKLVPDLNLLLVLQNT